jgi:outer membrane lipoprotein-sorting protein
LPLDEFNVYHNSHSKVRAMNRRKLTLIVFGMWLALVCGLLIAGQGRAGTVVNARSVSASELAFAGGFPATPLKLSSQAGQREKPVEQEFENIQALKGLPSSQIYNVMNFMRVSLGVRCEYCHVKGADGWEWAKDDKPAKQTARKHIQLTIDINRTTYGGQNVVTCNTCHQGQTHPASLPALGKAATPIEPAAGATKQPEPLPSVEQVLANFARAVGGTAAIESLKTRLLKGTVTAHLLPNSPVEIYQKAPDKFLRVMTTPEGVSTLGFDGTTGWVGNSSGTRQVSADALAALKREANFFRLLKIKEQYSSLRVTGREKVGEREAYVLEALTPDNQTEKLYFDTQTSLLLRKVRFFQTMVGAVPEMTDYEDYREVDGVKLPFTTNRSQLDAFEMFVLKLTEVRHNAAIEDSKFNFPSVTKK